MFKPLKISFPFHFVVFSSLLLSQFLCFGQDRIAQLKASLSIEKDTNLVKVLYELSDEMAGVDVSESIDYAQQSFELAKRLKYVGGMAISSFRLSSAFRLSGDFDQALKWSDIALKMSVKCNDIANQGSIYNEMAIIHSKLGDFDQSLTNYLKAIKIFESLEDPTRVARIQHNLGHLYRAVGDIEESKKSCLAALRLFEKNQDELSASGPCTCLGDAYLELNDIDSALYYYGRSLTVLDRYNEPSKMIAPLANMAMIYRESGAYDIALKMTKKASILSDSLGYDENTAICYQNIGEIYLAQQQLDSALFYFEKGGELFQKSGSQLDLMENYLAISAYFHLAGENDFAYDYLLKYNAVKDSLYNETKTQQLLEIKETFDTEKRQQKIAQLEAETKIKSSKLLVRNTLLIGSLLLIIALVIIVILYLKRLQAKQGKDKIELEQRILRAQMNPHFVFNSLNSIQRMYIDGNLDLANDYLSDFGSLLRKILDNSSKTQITIKDELETLALYLEMEKIRTSQKINYTITVSEEIDIYALKIPPLIIQPLVENAIWHGILPKGGNGLIEISLTLESAKLLLCTVIDDGVGMKEMDQTDELKSTKHQSKGIQITKDRLGIANAIHYSQLATGGTKVTMLIPTTHD